MITTFQFTIASKRFLLLCLLVVLVPLFSSAQEDIEDVEEGCLPPTSKKALKYYEIAKDRKKYKKPERMEALRQLLESAPEFAAGQWLMGYERIRTAKTRNAPLSSMLKYLEPAVSSCPTIHADAYYYLGLIYDKEKNNREKARLYYKQFLDFDVDDDDKYGRNHDLQYEEVKQRMKYLNFLHDMYTNPVPFEPERLQGVSTIAGEYLPLISPDNEFIYYTRRRKKTSKVHTSMIASDRVEWLEEFTVSRNEGEEFDGGDPMPAPFNQKRNVNYGGATISLDNKRIYLTVCQPIEGGHINCDIFGSIWTYGAPKEGEEEVWHWTELENLGPNVNTKYGWEGQPSLSADGTRLYFASWREDSREMDIYYSDLGEDGEWDMAKNMGPPVNTEKREKSPFIHTDSQTLYFSSTGHQGLGGFDVYLTRTDEEGKWVKPKNMGYPINTEKDEHGFTVSTDGSWVYFGSDQVDGVDGPPAGGLDIYTFELYEEARPEKVVFVKGEVKDEAGNPPADASVELKNMATKQAQRFKVDARDGKFAGVVVVKDKEDVVMNIKSKGMAFNAQLITPSDDKLPYQKVETKLQEVKVGEPYKMNDIYYATSMADLTPASLSILDEFIGYLTENPSMHIAIHGHTDSEGEENANLALSTDRAYSVMSYLQSKGIEKSRLSFKGFGETRPVASNNTADGRALNRRTEFVVMAQ